MPQQRIKAAGIVLHCPETDHVLILRRVSDDYWGIPGGYVEHDESPEDAAIRELVEETGFAAPEPDMLSLVGDNRGYRVFVVEVDEFSTPVLDEEHDEHLWTSRTALPVDLYPGLARIMEDV